MKIKTNKTKYKFLTSTQERFIDQNNDEPVSSIHQILDKLLFSFHNFSAQATFGSISELNRYIHNSTEVFNADDFNSRQVNIIFYKLLFDKNFSPFFDNIIRALSTLISIPGFDISPFENTNLFSQILFSVTPCLKYPSRGILILASILDASLKPRSIMLNSDIISNLFENAFTNESMKWAVFSFFASSLIILDESMVPFLGDLTSFFYRILYENISKPNIFYNYFEYLLQRLPSDYVIQCLANQIDFTPLLENFENNDKFDKIYALKLILLLLSKQNESILGKIDMKYFKNIFENQNSDSNGNNEEEIDDLISELFFKMTSKIFFFVPSFANYIDKLLIYSVNTIDKKNFKLKKAALSFLSKIIPARPDILPTLIQMNYISLLSLYLECTGNKIKNYIIKSLLYIMFAINSDNEEAIFSIFEEEEIYRKINEIEIDEKSVDPGEAKTKDMIDEFNFFYDELIKKMHYKSSLEESMTNDYFI